MLSALKEIIPGSDAWPLFQKNESEQFEARVVNVKITKTPSIFFTGMEGAELPIVTAHGEGRAVFTTKSDQTAALVAAQYIDSGGAVTERYPANPNGSPDGITALTSTDGRATIIMPHPERCFLTQQLSWHPDEWGRFSPWFKMFQNAREWVDSSRD